MSTYLIYYKDGAKMMRPVLNREEYQALRNSEEQQRLVHRVRKGETKLKNKLLQMNYSCLPNADGSLRGSKQMSSTIGMDVDFKAPDNLSPDEQQQWLTQQLAGVPERVLAKKDELGLLMLERSATKGFHLVFRRRPELTQEENLKWASTLLGVEYDTGAKDITRVFYTTTASAEDLLYLDDAIFVNTAAEVVSNTNFTNFTNFTNGEVLTNTDKTDGTDNPSKGKDSCNSSDSCSKEKNPSDPNNPCSEIVTVLQCDSSKTTNTNPASNEYNGVAFKDIIRKYWELFNGGKEPVEGDRNALTFELAVTLRSICGFSLERLMQVVPNYWAKSGTAESVSQADYEEWKKTLENALKEPHKGMPYRLKQVLQALKSQQGVKACGGTLTTPPNARRFFGKMVNDGTVSRLDVATIIRADDVGAERHPADATLPADRNNTIPATCQRRLRGFNYQLSIINCQLSIRTTLTLSSSACT